MADLPTPAPRDWHGALAALPDATPPADGWARVSRALDADAALAARIRTRRWPLWLAAAGVAALAALPLLPRLADRARPAPPSVARAPTGIESASPAAIARARNRPAGVGAEATATQATATDAARPLAAVEPDAGAPSRRSGPPAGAKAAPPAPVRLPAHARAPTRRSTAVATTDTPPATTHAANPPPGAISQTPDGDLPALQAESARLEALVALASDERVGSASSVVLTAGLQDRIGLIDTALSQVDLDDATRLALWQQRISTLRDLAGIESTQRWLATHGERYDGALVRID